ncbi:unnamed protein product [Allacma fusca]|uniref:Uncharacterized protein n=1 Tax=Allacma fusca TaxID=39272 RepID=A0A8J2PAL9_9HEXA|nr:unnamed protein product [Allacma fusca]
MKVVTVLGIALQLQCTLCWTQSVRSNKESMDLKFSHIATIRKYLRSTQLNVWDAKANEKTGKVEFSDLTA